MSDIPEHATVSAPSDEDQQRERAAASRGARAVLDRVRAAEVHRIPEIIVFGLAVGGLGFSALVPEHWLRGVLVLAGAMLTAGVFRIFLPAGHLGVLAVRSRTVDVIYYLAVGALIIFFGLILPRTR